MSSIKKEWENNKDIIVALKDRFTHTGRKNIEKEKRRFKIELFFDDKTVKLRGIENTHANPVMEINNIEIIKE